MGGCVRVWVAYRRASVWVDGWAGEVGVWKGERVVGDEVVRRLRCNGSSGCASACVLACVRAVEMVEVCGGG